MRFKSEMTNILDDSDKVIGFIDSKTTRLLFVPKGLEFDIEQLEQIIRKMKEMENELWWIFYPILITLIIMQVSMEMNLKLR